MFRPPHSRTLYGLLPRLAIRQTVLFTVLQEKVSSKSMDETEKLP